MDENKIKTYEVKYSVNGKSGYSKNVSAPSQGIANSVAKGKLEGQAGYRDKKISINYTRELR